MPTTISGTTGVSQIQDGVIVTEDIADAQITPSKLTQPLTLATAQATTSGTAIDFTGIPNWVKRITVMFSGVSTNGVSGLVLQLGTSGGVATSGYVGVASRISTTVTSQTNSASFNLCGGTITSSSSISGSMNVSNISGFAWSLHGNIGDPSNTMLQSFAGSISLAGVLTQVRLTTVNGTDTFDAGSVNIMYEG